MGSCLCCSLPVFCLFRVSRMKNQREVNFLKCKFSTKLPGFLNQKLVRKWSEIGCRNSKTSPKKTTKEKIPKPEAKWGPTLKKDFLTVFCGAVLIHPLWFPGVKSFHPRQGHFYSGPPFHCKLQLGITGTQRLTSSEAKKPIMFICICIYLFIYR